jgi:hypothetical protein
MATKKEQEWYRKFNEGTFLVKGWKARMNELLDNLPEQEKTSMGVMLAELGEKIGWEWAKDNRVRRVDTSMLQQWGENLQAANRRGRDALAKEIRKIDAELDDILA